MDFHLTPSIMPKNRLEGFSDGVIAIVITLLVLEIKVPHVAPFSDAGMMAALWHDIPKFGAYFVSFLVLAVWWMAHHHFFAALKHVDRSLLWLNMGFLMWLTLLPFPTAMLGDYPFTRASALLYGLVASFASFFFYAMRRHATKARLFYPDVTEATIRHSMRRGLISPLLHSTATAVAVIAPKLAILIFAGITLYFTVPVTLERSLEKK